MAEANYNLNITVNTRATSSGGGTYTDIGRNLKNLKGSALATAQAFGPMSAAINQAFATIENARKVRTADIFKGISGGIKTEVANLESGLAMLKSSAAKAAVDMNPVRQAVLDTIATFQGVEPSIRDISLALDTLSAEGVRTKGEINGLTGKFTAAAAVTKGPLAKGLMGLATNLQSLSKYGDVTGEHVRNLKDQFNSLLIKTTKLPQPLKEALTAFSGSLPKSEEGVRSWIKKASAASALVVPGFEKISAAFGESIPKLETLANSLAALKTPPAIKDFLNELDKGEPKTEAAAMKLRDLALAASQDTTPRFQALTAAIRATLAEFDKLVAEKGIKLTPEMATVKREMAGTGPTTAQGANKVFRDLQILGEQLTTMGPEYDALREALASIMGTSEQWVGTLEDLSAEQRRNMQAARGMTAHTREANEALMVTQSLAQGAMMGYALMRGSILQLGFGLIFMRFSEIKLVLAQAVLIASLGLLQKAIRGVTTALIENGKTFIDQELIVRRFETDITKLADAYPALVKAAVAGGRSVEDTMKTWEAFAAKGLATAEAQYAAFNMAAMMGTDAATAAGNMMSVVEGESDAYRDLLKSMGETNTEYLNSAKAQWNLMTIQERLNLVIKDTNRLAKESGKEFAISYGALKQSISTAVTYATGNLGHPFVEKFINPIMVALRDAGLAAMAWTDAWLKTKGAIALMKELNKTGKALAGLVTDMLNDLGAALKVIIPPLLGFISLGLKLLVMVLTPIAKMMKVLAPIIMLLGAMILKYLTGVILGSIIKLSAFQKGLGIVRVALYGLIDPLGMLGSNLRSVGNILQKGFGNQLFNMMAQMQGQGASSLKIFTFGLKALGQQFLITSKAFITSPMGKVITILAILAAVIMTNEKAMAAFQNVIDSFMPIIEAISGLFSATAEGLASALVPVLKTLSEIIAAVLVPALNALAWLIRSIANPINTLINHSIVLRKILQILGFTLMLYFSGAIVTKIVKGIMTMVKAIRALTLAKVQSYIVTKALIMWDTLLAVKEAILTGATYALAAAFAVLDAVMDANPVGLIIIAIAAVIAAIVALVKWHDKVIRFFDSIGWTITACVQPLIDLVTWILGGSPGLIPALKKVMAPLYFFSRGLVALKSILWLVVTAAQSVVSAVSNIGPTFKTAWDTISSWWSGAGDWFTQRWTDIKNAFSNVGEWFSATFSGAWENVKTAFTGVGTWFSERFQEARDGITSIWTTVGTWFGDRWQNIKDAFGAVVDFFVGEPDGIFFKPWDKIKGIWNEASEFFTKVKGWVTAPFDKLYDFFCGVPDGVFTKAWNKVTEVWGQVTGFFSGLFNSIKSIFSGLAIWWYENINIPIASGINDLIEVYNKIPLLPDVSLIDVDAMKAALAAMKEAKRIADQGVVPAGPNTGGATRGYGHPVYEMATGGITFPHRPIIAKIGEGTQREVVAPLNDLSRFIGTGRPTINVLVTGNTITNEELVNELTDQVTAKITRSMSRSMSISSVGF